MRHSRAGLAAAALLCGLAGAGAAQTGPLPAPVTDLRLIEGWLRDDGARVAAIRMRLAPGWKTYWRSPGAAGIPPQFDWTASENLAGVAYEWPRPILFHTYGVQSIGFKDLLVLPVVLTPQDPATPLDASVDVLFGVCDEVCIPVEARLTARLGADAPPAPEGRAEIERALASRPQGPRAAGVTAARCALSVDADGPLVTADVTFATPPAPGLTTVIEAGGRPDLWISETETETEGPRVRATARVASDAPGGIALDREGLRITLLDARRAIDIRGCAAD